MVTGGDVRWFLRVALIVYKKGVALVATPGQIVRFLSKGINVIVVG